MLESGQAARPAAAAAPPPKLGRRERHRLETRARIVQAALALFARQGFAGTRVEQITEAADVGKGTFFNYFPTKEHVLAGFAGKQIAKIQAALELAREGTMPLREVLFQLLLALQSEPGQNPELTRSLLVALLSSPAVRELANPHLKRGRELLADIFELGRQRGEIRADVSSVELARFFQLSAFGTMFLWSLHPTPKLTAWQRSTFELVWAAFAPLARSSPLARKGRAKAGGTRTLLASPPEAPQAARNRATAAVKSPNRHAEVRS